MKQQSKHWEKKRVAKEGNKVLDAEVEKERQNKKQLFFKMA
jgi:hypothetical protein